MKYFDILLVLGYFRSATAYLSIIRYLSSEFRIGVLPVEADPSLKNKTGEAHALYLRLCVDFGAQIVDVDEPVQAGLMMVQQFPYPDELATRVMAKVSSDRRVGLMTLAMAGIEQHDHFLAQFFIHKAYVPSRRFTNFLLERRQAAGRYAGVMLEEVGLPFGKYPIFPEFRVDWLIAAPTLFSFYTEAGKQAFLHSVLKLLSSIPGDQLVVYKPHNGNVLDYFAPRFHYRLARLLLPFHRVDGLVDGLARRMPPRIRRQLDRLLTSLLHLRVLCRAKPMASLTAYADISLEAFLPGVRKGVIGGLSNTIWGTLYFGLPFLNCIDPAERQGKPELHNKSSDNLLDLNLQYFGIPFCRGELTEGASGEEIVTPADRLGDLIGAVRRDIAGQLE